MASKTAILIVAATALSACAYRPGPDPEAGVQAVHVPVVSRENFAFDAAAPGGNLPPSEAARLDGWFSGLGLRYGDAVYVDAGPYSEASRAQVAAIAGRYGLLVSPGAPVTAGPVLPGNVRVVVTRTVASVPDCPNWDRKAQPNYTNKMLPGFGCAVNGALAQMVANPEDLIHGRDSGGITDATTAAKAVNVYRTKEPTGTGGLKEVNTKSGGSK